MEQQEYRGHTVEIMQDETPMNPRTEFDNLGTMACFHSRYDLGDERDFDECADLIAFTKRDDVIALPLFLLDHSGIWMNTGGFGHCDPGGWDSGQVGYIFITKEKIREEYSVKRISKKLIKKVIACLESEVETYNQYLTGEIFGYNVDDVPEGSCWGFYGTDFEENGLMEYAKGAIDCHIQEEMEAKVKKLKAFIRNKVPLINRAFA